MFISLLANQLLRIKDESNLIGNILKFKKQDLVSLERVSFAVNDDNHAEIELKIPIVNLSILANKYESNNYGKILKNLF